MMIGDEKSRKSVVVVGTHEEMDLWLTKAYGFATECEIQNNLMDLQVWGRVALGQRKTVPGMAAGIWEQGYFQLCLWCDIVEWIEIDLVVLQNNSQYLDQTGTWHQEVPFVRAEHMVQSSSVDRIVAQTN